MTEVPSVIEGIGHCGCGVTRVCPNIAYKMKNRIVRSQRCSRNTPMRAWLRQGQFGERMKVGKTLGIITERSWRKLPLIGASKLATLNG